MALATTHPRILVRKAAIAQIIGTAPNFRTVAGDKVRASRRSPWRAIDLPGLVVYTTDETITEESRSSAPTNLERIITMKIEAAVAASELATTQADDAADILARQVEVAIIQDESLGIDDQTIGLTGDYCRLVQTELEIFEDGSTPIAAAVLTFNVRVFDKMLDSLGPLDDFVTADIKYDLGGAQADAEVTEDVVTLPT